MYFKLKRTKADAKFSQYIRMRANWQCERCFVDCSDNHGYLDCSHYFSRAKRNTRFDPENAMAACKKCHDFLGRFENRGEHEAIFIKRLGQKRFDLLTFRASIPGKPDEKGIILWCEDEIKKLKEKESKNIIGYKAK